MLEPREILIVGASVRAATQSAVRVGFRVHACDFFADEDTQAAAETVLQIEGYQDPKLLQVPKGIPWIYVGAMENVPDAVASLSANRPCWGNSAETLRAVRDPFALHRFLISRGFPTPEIFTADTPPKSDGTWMLKPVKSAGGQAVQIWDDNAAKTTTVRPTLDAPHYFQQRIPGPSYSCLLLSNCDETVLIGASKLFTETVGCSPFLFSGAIGPIRFDANVMQSLRRMAQAITWQFGLRGIWGMDFLLEDNTPFIIEINPRYTATVELYEAAFQQPIFRFLSAAFDDSLPPSSGSLKSIANREPSRVFAKRIVYAPRTVVVPSWSEHLTENTTTLSPFPIAADRPVAGTTVQKDEPICTVFAVGESAETAELRLEESVQKVLDYFDASNPPFG